MQYLMQMKGVQDAAQSPEQSSLYKVLSDEIKNKKLTKEKK